MGESENKSPSQSSALVWVVIAGLSGFFILVAIAPRPRSGTSPANACINNLRQIDAAINEWAYENHKTNGTVVTANDITNYIKLNQYGKIPPCPSGGKYTFGNVGDTPQVTCSLSTAIPPHVLP
jgi:hypothetical protein